MIEEIWKDIPNYDGLYQASNLGRIKSIERMRFDNHNLLEEKILKPAIQENGYCRIGLQKNNKRKSYQVHRLVALTFIPNLENKRTVNHIDGNKLNNNVNNLEWATDSENLKHAYDNHLFKTIPGWKNRKKIYQYDLQDNLIKEWESITIAENETGITNISRCCLSNYRTAGNFKWKYTKL